MKRMEEEERRIKEELDSKVSTNDLLTDRKSSLEEEDKEKRRSAVARRRGVSTLRAFETDMSIICESKRATVIDEKRVTIIDAEPPAPQSRMSRKMSMGTAGQLRKRSTVDFASGTADNNKEGGGIDRRQSLMNSIKSLNRRGSHFIVDSTEHGREALAEAASRRASGIRSSMVDAITVRDESACAHSH